MTWQTILKMPVASNNTMVAYNLVNQAQFEKYLQEVKDSLASGDANEEGSLNSLSNLLRQVGTNQLSLEKFIEQWSNSPHMDLTVPQIQENLNKLTETLQFLTRSEILKLIEEAIRYKNESNHTKVKEILSRIDKYGSLGVRTLNKQPKIKAKLKYLRLDAEKSYIYFKNSPPTKSQMEKFAELLGGKSNQEAAKVEGDIILVNAKSLNEFTKLLQPNIKRNKNGEVEVLDNDNTVKEKALALKLYNEFKASNGISLNIDSKSVEIDPKKIEATTLAAKEVKYIVVEPFTSDSIKKYMAVIDRVQGKVTSFKPKGFREDDRTLIRLPSILFLEKGSKKSFNFNPYAEIVIENKFQSTTWADVFFDKVRSYGSLSVTDARTLIVEDIARTLPVMNKSSSEEYNIPLRIFRTEIENVNLEFDKLKKKVYDVLKERDTAEESVRGTVDTLREERYQFLKNKYTIKEAKAIKRHLLAEGFPEEEIKIEYYQRGSKAAYEGREYDKQGNVVRNADGSIRLKEYDGADRADSAKILLLDEYTDEFTELTFDEAAKQEGIEVTTAQKTSDVKEKISSKLTEIKEELETSRNSVETSKDPERLKKKIERLEKKMKALESQLKEDLDRDIGEATQKLRNQINSKGNFPTFLIDFAKDNNLMEHATSLKRDKTALNIISAERSLIFLASINAIREDQVKKSFKVIDANIKSKPEIAKKEAEKLNGKMADILNKAREDIVKGFKVTLENLAENPEKFEDTMVKQVLDKLSQTGLLIRREEQ